MRDHELAKVREWAQSKLDALDEPDWAMRRCQHIITLIDDMLGSPAPVVRRHRGNIIELDSVRRRRSAARYCATRR